MKKAIVVLLLIPFLAIASLACADEMESGLWLYNCPKDGTIYKSYGNYVAFDMDGFEAIEAEFSDGVVSAPLPVTQKANIADIEIINNTNDESWSAITSLIELNNSSDDGWYGFRVLRVVIDPCGGGGG